MRTLGQRFLPKILSVGLIVFASGCAAGCPHKAAAPVSVTREDAARAVETAHEGDLAFRRKDYYAALIKYLDAARLNPNSDNFANRLGITYAQLKYYEQARQAFQRAIALNPKFSYAFNNLGSVFFAQRNLKKAEACFKKAISLKGDEASFHMNLGSFYIEKKKADKAMAEFRKGFALDPQILSKTSAVSLTGGGSTSSLMEKYYFAARLYASAGQVESTIDSLKQAIDNGFSKIDMVEKERDFDPIRQDARFEEFLKNASLLIRLRAKVGLPNAEAGPLPNN